MERGFAVMTDDYGEEVFDMMNGEGKGFAVMTDDYGEVFDMMNGEGVCCDD